MIAKKVSVCLSYWCLTCFEEPIFDSRFVHREDLKRKEQHIGKDCRKRP